MKSWLWKYCVLFSYLLWHKEVSPSLFRRRLLENFRLFHLIHVNQMSTAGSPWCLIINSTFIGCQLLQGFSYWVFNSVLVFDTLFASSLFCTIHIHRYPHFYRLDMVSDENVHMETRYDAASVSRVSPVCAINQQPPRRPCTFTSRPSDMWIV
jgi:hypothetical protein